MKQRIIVIDPTGDLKKDVEHISTTIGWQLKEKEYPFIYLVYGEKAHYKAPDHKLSEDLSALLSQQFPKIIVQWHEQGYDLIVKCLAQFKDLTEKKS